MEESSSQSLKSLDEKLLAFQKKELSAADFKADVEKALASITAENILSHAQEFLVIKLCVSVLNDPDFSKAFEEKKAELAKFSENMVRAELFKIDVDENLSVVEKAQKIDTVVATCFSLKENVPKKVSKLYEEFSAKYVDEVVAALRDNSEGLYANMDVAKIQRQIFSKVFSVGDKEQRKAPGKDDASLELAAAYNRSAEGVTLSVIRTRDTNAAILCAKRWIEIAALAYKSGDIQGANYILVGLLKPPLTRIMLEISDPHAKLRAQLDSAISSGLNYANMKRSEELATEARKSVIPSYSYKLTELTFMIEANEKKGPLLAERLFDNLRRLEQSFGARPKTELVDTFGHSFMQPLNDVDECLFRAAIDTESKGQELIPENIQSGKVKKAKGFVPEEVSEEASKPYTAPVALELSAEEQQEKKNKTIEESVLVKLHKFHLEQHGYSSKGFYNSRDYKIFEAIKAAFPEYLKRNNNNLEGFEASPEYLAVLEKYPLYDQYLNPEKKGALYAEFEAEKQSRDAYAAEHNGSLKGYPEKVPVGYWDDYKEDSSIVDIVARRKAAHQVMDREYCVHIEGLTMGNEDPVIVKVLEIVDENEYRAAFAEAVRGKVQPHLSTTEETLAREKNKADAMSPRFERRNQSSPLEAAKLKSPVLRRVKTDDPVENSPSLLRSFSRSALTRKGTKTIDSAIESGVESVPKSSEDIANEVKKIIANTSIDNTLLANAAFDKRSRGHYRKALAQNPWLIAEMIIHKEKGPILREKIKQFDLLESGHFIDAQWKSALNNLFAVAQAGKIPEKFYESELTKNFLNTENTLLLMQAMMDADLVQKTDQPKAPPLLKEKKSFVSSAVLFNEEEKRKAEEFKALIDANVENEDLKKFLKSKVDQKIEKNEPFPELAKEQRDAVISFLKKVNEINVLDSYGNALVMAKLPSAIITLLNISGSDVDDAKNNLPIKRTPEPKTPAEIFADLIEANVVDLNLKAFLKGKIKGKEIPSLDDKQREAVVAFLEKAHEHELLSEYGGALGNARQEINNIAILELLKISKLEVEDAKNKLPLKRTPEPKTPAEIFADLIEANVVDRNLKAFLKGKIDGKEIPSLDDKQRDAVISFLKKVNEINVLDSYGNALVMAKLPSAIITLLKISGSDVEDAKNNLPIKRTPEPKTPAEIFADLIEANVVDPSLKAFLKGKIEGKEIPSLDDKQRKAVETFLKKTHEYEFLSEYGGALGNARQAINNNAILELLKISGPDLDDAKNNLPIKRTPEPKTPAEIFTALVDAHVTHEGLKKLLNAKLAQAGEKIPRIENPEQTTAIVAFLEKTNGTLQQQPSNLTLDRYVNALLVAKEASELDLIKLFNLTKEEFLVVVPQAPVSVVGGMVEVQIPAVTVVDVSSDSAWAKADFIAALQEMKNEKVKNALIRKAEQNSFPEIKTAEEKARIVSLISALDKRADLSDYNTVLIDNTAVPAQHKVLFNGLTAADFYGEQKIEKTRDAIALGGARNVGKQERIVEADSASQSESTELQPVKSSGLFSRVASIFSRKNKEKDVELIPVTEYSLAYSAEESVFTSEQVQRLAAQYNGVRAAFAEGHTERAMDLFLALCTTLSKEIKTSGKVAGADDILPALIQIISAAQPRHIDSEMAAACDKIFGQSSGEKAYYAVTLYSSIMAATSLVSRSLLGDQQSQLTQTDLDDLLNRYRNPGDQLFILEAMFEEIKQNNDGLYAPMKASGLVYEAKKAVGKQNYTSTQLAHIKLLQHKYVQILQANPNNFANPAVRKLVSSSNLLDFETNYLYFNAPHRVTESRKRVMAMSATDAEMTLDQMFKVSGPDPFGEVSGFVGAVAKRLFNPSKKVAAVSTQKIAAYVRSHPEHATVILADRDLGGRNFARELGSNPNVIKALIREGSPQLREVIEDSALLNEHPELHEVLQREQINDQLDELNEAESFEMDIDDLLETLEPAAQPVHVQQVVPAVPPSDKGKEDVVRREQPAVMEAVTPLQAMDDVTLRKVGAAIQVLKNCRDLQALAKSPLAPILMAMERDEEKRLIIEARVAQINANYQNLIAALSKAGISGEAFDSLIQGLKQEREYYVKSPEQFINGFATARVIYEALAEELAGYTAQMLQPYVPHLGKFDDVDAKRPLFEVLNDRLFEDGLEQASGVTQAINEVSHRYAQLEERNPPVTQETKLIDLVRAHGDPLVVTQASAREQDNPLYNEGRPFVVYHDAEKRRAFYKKDEKGPVYSYPFNRKDQYKNFVTAFTREAPHSDISYFTDLMWGMSVLESSRDLYLLEACAKDRSPDTMSSFFMSRVYAPLGQLEKLIQDERYSEKTPGEKAQLLKELKRVKAEFQNIEKNVREWELSRIDRELQKINLNGLQGIRQFVERQLGDKTVNDLPAYAQEESIAPIVKVTVREDILVGITAALNQANLTIGQSGHAVIEGEGKPFGTDGKIEIRYFAEGEKNDAGLAQLQDRINFLRDVAKGVSDHSQFDAIAKKYMAYAEAHFAAISSAVMEEFEKEAKGATKMFLEMEKELVAILYPDLPLDKAMKKLADEVNEFLIKRGRPTILHVMADGSFDVLIPKGDISYPSTYRKSEQSGVNPNSVLQIVGTVGENNTLTVDATISRAVSFSVLGLKGKNKKDQRVRLNYLNTKTELENLLSMMDFNDGDTVTIQSTSYLTPSKYEKGITRFLTGLIGFASESRQIKDHTRLDMFDGDTITVIDEKTGKPKTATIDISHMNFSVKNPNKMSGRENEALRDLINNRGFARYVSRQYRALAIAHPELKAWLEENCYRKPSKDILFLEKRLKDENKKLRDIELIQPVDPKTAREQRKVVTTLKQELSQAYAKHYESIREKWQQGIPEGLPRGVENNPHLQLFMDVQRQFYSGDYKKNGDVYVFSAQMSRTDEMAGVLELKNCKSANDRTKWVIDAVRLLLKYARDHVAMNQKAMLVSSPDRKTFIEDNYQVLHHQGAGYTALTKNRPGALGSALNNPFGHDASKKDSLVSKWGKVKPTKRDVFRYWLKPKPAERDMFDLLAKMRTDDSDVSNAYHLRNMDNKILSTAMLNSLNQKEIRISHDISKAVDAINELIPAGTVIPNDFLQKYAGFLGIVNGIPGIPGINDIRKEFMVAILLGNQNPNFNNFKEEMKEVGRWNYKALTELQENIKLELSNLQLYINHFQAATDYLQDLPGEYNIEVMALSEQVMAMAKLNMLLAGNISVVEQARARLKSNVSSVVLKEEMRETVSSTKLIKEIEVVSVSTVPPAMDIDDAAISIALPGAPKDLAKEDVEKVIVFKPHEKQGKRFTELSPDKVAEIQEAREAREHLIEVRKSTVSYSPPEGKLKLGDSEMIRLVDRMLDEALKKFKNPDDLVFHGEGKLVEMAKERLADKLRAAPLDRGPERSEIGPRRGLGRSHRD